MLWHHTKVALNMPLEIPPLSFDTAFLFRQRRLSMLTCLQRISPRLAFAGLCLLLLALWPSALFASGGSSCSSGSSPAFAADSSVHIPGVFRPGVTGLACDQLPSGMDSSGWESLTVPSRFASHEQYQGLDVLGDFLYVAYNAGIQVWDIGGEKAEQPVEVAAADGFPPFNNWLIFPHPAEDDFFVEDIDVLAPSSGGSLVYIAVAARGPVGFSIWQFNTNNGALTQLFQETSNSRMARLVEFDGPTGPVLYAFSGHGNGVRVFNVTEAIAAAPCADDAGVSGSPCPNVFEGSLSTNSGGFIDTYVAPSGAIYLSNSDGNLVNSLGVELWQINNPSNPSGAIKRFSGLNTVSFGTSLFEKGGDTYLSVVERVGSSNRIKIFDIDACLTSNCSGTPGTLVFDDLPLPPYSTRQFLTYSEGGSNNVPFLYYGLRASSLAGDHVEQLLDLTSLGTVSQNITEMTDGGPTYFDTCQQEDLGYWSYYYPGNEFGIQNFTPRIGKFNPGTIYFYRAARGLIDVHVWEGGSSGDPNISTSIEGPQNNYWMGEDVDFVAFGGNGCVPNPAAWVWTDITKPAGVSHQIISQTGNRATIRFTCDDAVNRCADAAVSVNAVNVDFTCASAVENSAALTVEDPRLGITLTPAGGTYPQCTVIDFEATLAGRGPANFVWKVDGVPDNAGTASDENLESLGFLWDTTNVVVSDQIFTDGFETGNVSIWSAVQGLAGGGALTILNPPQSRGGGAGTPFDISIELTSAFSDPTMAESTVRIEAVGSNPRFATGVDPIVATTSDGGATWDFTANALDASEFTWEFEDVDGTEICTFGPNSNVACDRVSGGQNISHTWILQSGTRRVNLTISNCNASQEASASTSVEVVSTEPLEVTEFRLFSSVAGNPDCLIQDAACIGLLGPPVCICKPGGDSIFSVTATGSPTTLAIDWDGNGTFESSMPFSSTITHTYPSVVNSEFRPSIKAIRGSSESDVEANREELLIQNF